MMIPFGRRRLILSMALEPVPHRPLDIPTALTMTDQQLALLPQRLRADRDRARWEAMLTLYGHRPT